jgi:hypothetical protein
VIASFDRRKCKVTSGPNATGQHCPEGWTFYERSGPAFQGAASQLRTDTMYLTQVEGVDASLLSRHMTECNAPITAYVSTNCVLRVCITCAVLGF